MTIKQQDNINLIISFVNIPLMVNEWVISWYISLGISLLTLYTDYERGGMGLVRDQMYLYYEHLLWPLQMDSRVSKVKKQTTDHQNDI